MAIISTCSWDMHGFLLSLMIILLLLLLLFRSFKCFSLIETGILLGHLIFFFFLSIIILQHGHGDPIIVSKDT